MFYCAFLVAKVVGTLEIIPQKNIPPESCLEDKDCISEKSCTTSVCNTGRCSHFFQEQCCPNLVCDAGEDISQCSDCKLSTLDTSTCSDCKSPKGFMFDVSSVQEVTIKSLKIQLYNGTNDIIVYTSNGTYSDKATDHSKWIQIYSNSFSLPGEGNEILLTTAHNGCSYTSLLFVGKQMHPL